MHKRQIYMITRSRTFKKGNGNRLLAIKTSKKSSNPGLFKQRNTISKICWADGNDVFETLKKWNVLISYEYMGGTFFSKKITTLPLRIKYHTKNRANQGLISIVFDR